MAKRRNSKSSTRKTSKAKPAKKATAAGSGIQAWQDDPLGLPAVPRPVPKLNQAPLKFKIKGPAVVPGVYPIGTPQFRYWTAAEAARRGGDFWASKGIKKWQATVGSSLPIGLDNGVDLNAYYDRTQLAFFHDTVKNKTLFSGESPDIVCHELGHAVLDAHRPQLWDAPFIEVGSFHEHTGDASAILAAFQLPGVRAAALPGIKSNKASVISRLAEQLGWAIRQSSPGSVDSDCLRNAANKFKYVDPNTLPPFAPSTQLCAEVHSFSRVFTGAFYDILSGMLAIISSSPKADDLLKLADDYAMLFVDATAAAPVTPNFYAQVAARMIDADLARFQGKYRQPLKDAFVNRKILSANIVAPVAKVPKGVQKAAAAFAMTNVVHTEIHKVVLPATALGLTKGDIVVRAPVESSQPLAMGMAELRSGEGRRTEVERASQHFVAMLAANGRIAMTGQTKMGMTAKTARTPATGASKNPHTHRLVKTKEGLELQRIRFLCGCRRWWF
jgi:hypothetical protein